MQKVQVRNINGVQRQRALILKSGKQNRKNIVIGRVSLNKMATKRVKVVACR
jgi:hypothetical protein